MIKDRKELGKHDYYLDNLDSFIRLPQLNSCSIGIFKWIPRVNNNSEMKESKAVFRIKIKTDDREKVIHALENYCDMLDIGWIPKYKTITLR